MKTIRIPYIEGLESLSFNALDEKMETGAAKGVISEVNWQEYPYTPAVAFSIARSRTHIVILYHVRGFDLRSAALEDNGNVWEDSCCEFFVSHPSDGTYYNFELNCVGTLLAAKRHSRNDAVQFSQDELCRIIRHTTLERKEYDEKDIIRCWSVGIAIPFDLIGLDGAALPENIRANFYKCGDKTAHPHFLSWNRIDTPSPDFHRPDFFGEIRF
ncbi:MAG: hypothetical protein IJ402_05300 [Bacteroidales bacterium]|nr:hypothetical protein [Bacteroidales bacterium]